MFQQNLSTMKSMRANIPKIKTNNTIASGF